LVKFLWILKILKKNFILALFHLKYSFLAIYSQHQKRAHERSRGEIDVAAAHVGPKPAPKIAPALVFEHRSH
jgi:hypothetical protein